MDSDQLVKRVAFKVRREVKRLAGADVDGSLFNYIDHKDLGGGCSISSYIMVKVLERLGVSAKMVSGIFGSGPQYGGWHAWVEYEGAIYDVTATQFGVRRAVHITEPDDPDYGACECCNPPRFHYDELEAFERELSDDDLCAVSNVVDRLALSLK